MRSMRVLRSHRFAVVTALAAVGAPGVWLFARHSSGPDSAIVARVKRGPFVVTVTTAGELRGKKLAKEEAVYEAPTVKRQAEIDYEKAERALAQAKTDYETKTEQARAKMREVGADLARQKNTLKVVQEAMAGCTVKAPGPGMVI